MAKRSVPAVFAALFVALLFSSATFAQTTGAGAKPWPTRLVRIVLPGSPGAGSDIIGRVLAQPLTKNLGQTFIIDNRPGAANIIATEVAAKAPADGYTLLIGTTGTFITNPLVYAKLPFSIKDFETVSNVVDAPFVLATHPSVPVKNVADLVALAKARPAQLAVASFGIGSSTHRANCASSHPLSASWHLTRRSGPSRPGNLRCCMTVRCAWAAA